MKVIPFTKDRRIVLERNYINEEYIDLGTEEGKAWFKESVMHEAEI